MTIVENLLLRVGTQIYENLATHADPANAVVLIVEQRSGDVRCNIGTREDVRARLVQQMAVREGPTLRAIAKPQEPGQTLVLMRSNHTWYETTIPTAPP
jgi:hypothetical protein